MPRATMRRLLGHLLGASLALLLLGTLPAAAQTPQKPQKPKTAAQQQDEAFVALQQIFFPGKRQWKELATLLRGAGLSVSFEGSYVRGKVRLRITRRLHSLLRVLQLSPKDATGQWTKMLPAATTSVARLRLNLPMIAKLPNAIVDEKFVPASRARPMKMMLLLSLGVAMTRAHGMGINLKKLWRSLTGQVLQGALWSKTLAKQMRVLQNNPFASRPGGTFLAVEFRKDPSAWLEAFHKAWPQISKLAAKWLPKATLLLHKTTAGVPYLEVRRTDRQSAFYIAHGTWLYGFEGKETFAAFRTFWSTKGATLADSKHVDFAKLFGKTAPAGLMFFVDRRLLSSIVGSNIVKMLMQGQSGLYHLLKAMRSGMLQLTVSKTHASLTFSLKLKAIGPSPIAARPPSPPRPRKLLKVIPPDDARKAPPKPRKLVLAPRKGVETWKVTLGSSPAIGPKDAPVTIVEFSDFQCPYCSRGSALLKMLQSKYKGQLRVVFKHFPLSFHKDAHLAAQASMAAHAQGKFWAYHDKLFANQSALKRADLERYAKELKLDMTKFKAALDNGTYKKAVDADLDLGEQVDVRGTPSLYVNGQKARGWGKKLLAHIEDELTWAKKRQAEGWKGGALYRALAASGKISLRYRQQHTVYKVPTANAPAIGPKDAHVTIAAFSGFACSYCKRANFTLDKLKRAYKKNVRIVFKHFPLKFQKNAHLSAYAAIAAQAQGKFWAYHDKLFANQGALSRADLERYAKELKLDLKKFRQVMNAPATKARIKQELAEAKKLDVQGTPTFFVNGRILAGAQPYAAFKKKIDAILLKKGFKEADLPAEPADQIPLQGSPSKGPDKPLVTIIEFSDFQCPYCSRAAFWLGRFGDVYKQYVRVVFKHFPLSFHKQAHIAAQASMAAHAQGKFWKYHDLLFANQRQLKRPALERYAKILKLDMAKFKAALDKGTYKSAVDADFALGMRIGVGGTPTFYVNGRKSKSYSPMAMKKEVDKLLIARGVKPSALPKLFGIPLKGSPSLGPKDAPVTLVEFSDFQCPYCSRAASIVKPLRKLYPKHVRIVFKHFPLNFHKDAHLAAQASMAAHAQGKFWAYHDKLFANQSALKRADLERYAKEIKLDMAKFKAALDNGTYKKAVDDDMKLGTWLSVGGTPTFLINGKQAKVYDLPGFQREVNKILVARGIKPPPAPKAPGIPLKGSPSLGPKDAAVTIVEFSDFQCPYCSRAASIVKPLRKLYPKHVRIVFKHFPLSFHKDAHLAAQASMAAHAQGKFWAYHDKLFANQSALKRADLERYAKEIKLDMAKFKAALDKGTYKQAVDNDLKLSSRLNVEGTPTFYINGEPAKVYDLPGFKQEIEKILRAKGKRPKSSN